LHSYVFILDGMSVLQSFWSKCWPEAFVSLHCRKYGWWLN